MAIYNVVGVGQHNKFFDDNSYHDVLDYIFNQEKAVESIVYYIKNGIDNAMNRFNDR